MMTAAATHVYITPHCTEPDLAMPFIEAIAPATAPSAISWRRARLPARSRDTDYRRRRFIREQAFVEVARILREYFRDTLRVFSNNAVRIVLFSVFPPEREIQPQE